MSRRSRLRGVSLLEALVAMALLSLGLHALWVSQRALRHHSTLVRDVDTARMALRSSLASVHQAQAPAGDAERALPSLGSTINLRTQTVVSAHGGHLRALRAEAHWTDSMGAPQRVSLQTARYRDPQALAAATMLARAPPQWLPRN
jgi:Tfp pilus assembly protein PilV